MLTISRTLYIILISILLTGMCYSSPNISVQNSLETYISTEVNNPFQLKVNQIARIAEENLEIQLVDIQSDSRCPQGLQCFWAGAVKVIIRIAKREKRTELTFIEKAETSQPDRKTFDNYSITLLNVEPYPVRNQKIELETYIVNLVVSRR